MNSATGAPTYGGDMMGYATVEALLDDVSRQMASSNITKYARGSAGQRPSGGSMRVVKPSSTSNSPRGSAALGRRRTLMTDRRRIAMADQNMVTAGACTSHDGFQVPPRSHRPFSWHPSSQMAPQPQFHSAYQFPPHQTQPDFHVFDLPPTPAIYSGHGSPDGTFSPLSTPFAAFEQGQPSTENTASYHSHHWYAPSQPATQPIMPYHPTPPANADSSMYLPFDWRNSATNGFESSTAPPTPESEIFLPIQHPESVFPADDAIPYHSLSDPEPEGEILQGLGLYDAPEISKPLPSAHQFDNYHALVMSQLLGTAYRKPEVEQTGKGLKLEETWTPPSDHEEDADDEVEDEESNQDGEGDLDEQPVTHEWSREDDYSQRRNGFMHATNVVTNGMQVNPDLHSSWI